MKILVMSVHPDDETLGCGGSILRHIAKGDEVCWLIVTQTYSPAWSDEVIARKAEEVQAVAGAYGVKTVTKLGLPTAGLDRISQGEVIAGIRKVINVVRPEIVYLIHEGDVHTDHHIVFAATMSVLKAFYMKEYGVRRVLSYETLSSTDAAPPSPHRIFLPAVYHDISSYIDRKIEIMGMYETEAQPDPLPRGPSAIRALARYRGATVGVDYAEAFMLIREVG